MSERKTTEIKLRVSPAEKTAWQAEAEQEGIGLSELIRREMNARAQITFLDSAVLVNTFGVAGSVAKPWTFEGRNSE